ncbi:Protein of unknown function [Granulicella pectinivorans]|uniref:DUF4199 domain-containing protein n=1 Tax=Granulicella pectinivorans TaxID=474950 RepID=A0A1I6LPW1_9BACT|nr:DUF4199 domain-containing protein [Granulicella pectinivorans]SFS05471.1 Protein of unknown function [Granulicella pectinivorans]
MKKTILTFGLISGVISSAMMVGTLPFLEKIGNAGYVIGYTSIVLSFLLVYFGIRSYRETNGEGYITFARGFGVGISITLISCIFYVVTWEIIYFKFMPHMMDQYGAGAIEKLRASGASAAAIQKQVEAAQHFREMYKNPFYNAAMTFIEPFPVGLVITLLSAAILRRTAKTPATLPATS